MGCVAGYWVGSSRALELRNTFLDCAKRYFSETSAELQEFSSQRNTGAIARLGEKGLVNSGFLHQRDDGTLLGGCGYLFSESGTTIVGSSQPCEFPTADNIPKWEGEFAVVLFQPQTGTLCLANDRFASRPLFYYSNDKYFLYSSDLVFLIRLLRALRISLELDSEVILQLFKYGHALDDRTSVRNIFKLTPATTISVTSPGQLTQRQYWTLTHRPSLPASPKQLADEIISAFKSSVTRRERIFAPLGKPMVALSGGLDSRLVAASLSQPTNCTALTLDAPGAVDRPVAEQVAKILGMPFVSKPIDACPLGDAAERLLRFCGGQVSLLASATSLPLFNIIDELTGGGSAILFGGWPGDVLAGSYIPPDPLYFDNTGVQASTSKYTAELGVPWVNLSGIFVSEGSQWHQHSQQSLLQAIRRNAGPTGAHLVTAWAHNVRQPNFSFISPTHQWSRLIDVTPHLGYSYVDLMLTLPAHYLNDKTFYKYILFENFPKLRDVIYANTGRRLSGELPGYPTIKKSGARGPLHKRIVSKIARTLFRTESRPAAYPYTDYVRAAIPQLANEQRIRRFLPDFMSQEGVNALLKRFESAGAATQLDTDLLVQLMGVLELQKTLE